MSTELQERSHEHTDAHEQEKFAIDAPDLNTTEFLQLMQSTISPENVQINTYRINVLDAIKNADSARSNFVSTYAWKQGNSYKIQEKELKASIGRQFNEMVTLKTTFATYCTTKITQLDNQYRFIRKMLPNTTDATKRMALERMMNVVLEAKTMYTDLKTMWNSIYKDAVELVRNKNDTRQYLLLKNDPYNRSSKDEKKKAKHIMKHWVQRSAKYALKYYWWGPIDEKDYNTCGITNKTIMNNQRIIAGMHQRAKERDKARKKEKILRRDPENPAIDIPDFSEDIIAAEQFTANITSDLVANNIDITLLTPATASTP